MDADRFDSLTRSLGTASSRRGALTAAVGGLFTLGALPADAKKSKKKPKLNAFGCVDVGQKCAGKNGKCCSGICQGKKPKKGKKDKSSCVAHNAGACTLDSCATESANVPCHSSKPCFCTTTTGKANFCGDFTAKGETLCRVCRKDTDCQAEFGPGAACVVLGGFCAGVCPTTGGTACAPPCA